MNAYSLADCGVLERLNGIPAADLAANLQSALQGGCRAGAVVREIVWLRAGAGRLTPQEYFWYRLWDPALPAAAKCRFVGKRAQHRVHVDCNHRLCRGRGGQAAVPAPMAEIVEKFLTTG